MKEEKPRAKFGECLAELFNLEYLDPTNALHKNPGEEGYTFMGIYQKYHPDLYLWTLLDPDLDIKEQSRQLSDNQEVIDEVSNVYKTKYWDNHRLGELYSTLIANEIFCFGVNVGMINAIRKAQQLVKVRDDGIMGQKTIRALNSYEEDDFDFQFDQFEKKHYKDLIAKRPSLKQFENGWMNRAEAV